MARWTKKPVTDGWYLMSFSGRRDDYASAIYIRDGRYNHVGSTTECHYDVSENVNGETMFYGPIAFPKRKVA